MIYTYINSISSEKILLSAIIGMFYTIYSINNSNISTKGVIGIIISIFFGWYIIDESKTISHKYTLIINNIITEIPILKGLMNYQDILIFFYESRQLIDYDYIHYKRSVVSCIEMMKIYETIKKSNRIRYNYDIILILRGTTLFYIILD